MNPFYGIEIVSIIFLFIITINILTKWKKATRTLKVFALDIISISLSSVCDVVSSFEPKYEVSFIDLLPYLFGCCASAFSWWYFTFLVNDEEHREVINPIFAKIASVVMPICILLSSISYSRGALYIVSEPDLAGNVTLEYGPALLIIYAVDILSVIAMSALIIQKRKHIKKSTMILILLPIILPLGGIVGEAFIPESILSLPLGTIGAYMQYLLLESHMVSDIEMREKIMLEMANVDVLTSLRNRRSYFSFLDEHPEEIDAGALFVDINNLKRTNDKLGHFEGDKLIARCATLLKENLPNSNLFRISGDEFVALYAGENSQQFFESETSNIRMVLKNNDSIASMGAYWGNKADLNTIIRNAEAEMYKEKNAYYISTGFERRRQNS